MDILIMWYHKTYLNVRIYHVELIGLDRSETNIYFSLFSSTTISFLLLQYQCISSKYADILLFIIVKYAYNYTWQATEIPYTDKNHRNNHKLIVI